MTAIRTIIRIIRGPPGDLVHERVRIPGIVAVVMSLILGVRKVMIIRG